MSRVSVRPSGTRCTLSVRYQGGTRQPGLGAATATRGRAAWTWHVPTDVQAGPAQTTVRCARAGAATRSLVIVGRLVEPKITVEKQGFSIRPSPGTGTRLSYGLILHNESPDRDAMNVSVQTNFVLADNNLLGTDTQRVTGIPPGADYALGRMIDFPARRADHAARGRRAGREVPAAVAPQPDARERPSRAAALRRRAGSEASRASSRTPTLRCRCRARTCRPSSSTPQGTCSAAARASPSSRCRPAHASSSSSRSGSTRSRGRRRHRRWSRSRRPGSSRERRGSLGVEAPATCTTSPRRADSTAASVSASERRLSRPDVSA